MEVSWQLQAEIERPLHNTLATLSMIGDCVELAASASLGTLSKVLTKCLWLALGLDGFRLARAFGKTVVRIGWRPFGAPLQFKH